MKTAFEKMMAGLDEVETYMKGQTNGFKVHVPGEVDVKAIRSNLGLTQSRFSDAFGFSLDAVKNWESHRRQPEAAARVLLTVIDHDPAAVIAALHPEILTVTKQSSRKHTYAQAKRYISRASKARRSHKAMHASV
jgi:putative transcriptional regulator